MYLVPRLSFILRDSACNRPCVRKAVVLEGELEMLGMSAVHSTKAITKPCPVQGFLMLQYFYLFQA